MAELHGKTGNFYSRSLAVGTTSTAWTAGVGTVVSTIDGPMDGYTAQRMTTTAVGALTLLAFQDFVAQSLAVSYGLVVWVRSSINTAAGDLRILLDDTSGCVSPLESLQIPALTANQWQLVFLPLANPSLLGAIISIGLYQQVDLADGTFDVAVPKRMQQQSGFTNWTLTHTGNVVDVTDFANAGVKVFLPGTSQWSGTMSSMKNTTGPIVAGLFIGDAGYMVFAEGPVAGQEFIGACIVTNATPVVDINDVVRYNYTVQGTGPLQVATV